MKSTKEESTTIGNVLINVDVQENPDKSKYTFVIDANGNVIEGKKISECDQLEICLQESDRSYYNEAQLLSLSEICKNLIERGASRKIKSKSTKFDSYNFSCRFFR